MIKGWLKMVTKDGEEVYEAGQACYWPPGHAPVALEDCEYVDSPADEFTAVIDHITAQGWTKPSAKRRRRGRVDGCGRPPDARRPPSTRSITAHHLTIPACRISSSSAAVAAAARPWS